MMIGIFDMIDEIIIEMYTRNTQNKKVSNYVLNKFIMRCECTIPKNIYINQVLASSLIFEVCEPIILNFGIYYFWTLIVLCGMSGVKKT